MKPMIWHPEEQDEKVRNYFDKVNHAPYSTIVTIGIIAFCLFTLMFLIGSF